MKKSARLVLFFNLLLCGGLVAAWDGVVSGKITQIDTVANQSGNYEMRIYLGGGQAMCNVSDPNLRGWAYLNSNDVNYKVVAANLMMAYIGGKNVVIHTYNDSGLGCHIHYVMVRD